MPVLKVENGKWKVENGEWKVESGEWKMESIRKSGKWKVMITPSGVNRD